MMWEQEESQESWEQAVRELRDKIPEIYPAWTDYNLHDPGITMLELFAWMQQAAQYRMGQIGEEHRKKYVKLLGMKGILRKPGKTMVTVPDRQGRYIEAGTRFFAENICFETRIAQNVTEGIFRTFISKNGGQETVLQGEWLAEGKGISLFPFGKYPAAGDSLEIQLEKELAPEGMHRLTMECMHAYGKGKNPVIESAFDGHGFYPLAEIELQYMSSSGWRKVEKVQDGTYGMIQDGSWCFELPSPMKKEDYRLRMELKRCDYILPPCITRISFAMVEVWQQETVEELPCFWGNGFPDQEFFLEDGEIELEGWKQVEDFDNSGPEDFHYTLERGILRFGDGFRGVMPEGKLQVTRMVRTLGDQGNIKAGVIRQMESDKSLSVINEYDVMGGTREETTEEIFKRFLKEREIQKRAVTWEDYETLVMEIPGLLIEKCKVFAGAAGSRTIRIAVKPYALDSCGVPNEAYKKNLYRYLEEKRMIGTRIEIAAPEYYGLGITCVISAKVQYRQAGELVEEAIRGWIQKKSFGDGVSYSQLMGLIEAQPCVQRIISLGLDTDRKGKRDPMGNLVLPPQGLIRLKQVSCQVMEAGEE